MTQSCIAFAGTRCIAAGLLSDVAFKTKEAIDRGETAPIVIFDRTTSAVVEIDWRGDIDDVRQRYLETPEPRGPGRPKLGVVAREVTLLPRHWDWLNVQPGGASVALRKLVDDARQRHEGRDRQRRAQQAAYSFMSALAGNEPGFEEAARSLFANDRDRFNQLIEAWPHDIAAHARSLAEAAFTSVD